MTVRTLTETGPKPWVYVATRRDGKIVAINSGANAPELFYRTYVRHRIQRFDTEAEWLAYLKARKARLL